MSESQSGPSERNPASSAAFWQARLKSLLPFVLTALVAVALSLFLQTAFSGHQRPAGSTAAMATVEAAPPFTPTPVEPATPVPTPPQPDERIISQELLDLQAELSRVWSAYYLMRAASQLADAEVALRVNELTEVERVLVTVKVSLDHAYDLGAEQDKGPIGEFRTQVGDMYEDLRVRPESMDQRMRRLRQDMLSLVDLEG